MTIRADDQAPPRLGDDPDSGTTDLLRHTADIAIDYRESLPDRRVGAVPGLTADDLRRRLGGPLPTGPTDPRVVIDDLVEGVDPGLVAISGPRYFGFVMGGSVPASLAADWLTSTWDQNVGLYLATPAASVVEEVVADWLVELLGLPAGTTVGFVSGATMANFTAIAAARHAVLRAAGWDVEENGLQGAPEVRVVVGGDVHVSLLNALRYAGLGRGRVTKIPSDDEGRMDDRALADALRGHDEPTIVAAQAGDVNTGAFDPIERIVPIVREHPNAWLHIDGAFGLWAAASPRLRHLVRGIDGADSWGTDAHKWLNVPYDAGIVFVRDGAAHRASMGLAAAYLPPAPDQERDPFEYVPEMSRRARGFPIYAAIRSLGASGIAEMVERDTDIASRIARRLANHPDVRIVNEVVLNQVLVAVGDAETTRAVVDRIQTDGVLWLGGTTFHGTPALRISVSGWNTRDEDADRSADAILAAVDAVRADRTGSPGG
ncbi:MAG TPA: aminotransferase class V-fold PLP-dependent enzyme [Candidatus Limnocylindrales bacterium]